MWEVVGAGLLGSLVGLFFGNRMALGRDKRKEFNEATVTLRQRLLVHLGQLERGRVPGRIKSEEIDSVVSMLGESRSQRIKRSFDRYDATVKKCVTTDGVGLPIPISPGCREQLIADARRLYSEVQPK